MNTFFSVAVTVGGGVWATATLTFWHMCLNEKWIISLNYCEKLNGCIVGEYKKTKKLNFLQLSMSIFMASYSIQPHTGTCIQFSVFSYEVHIWFWFCWDCMPEVKRPKIWRIIVDLIEFPGVKRQYLSC